MVSRIRGPRSTRSPRKTAFRPRGGDRAEPPMALPGWHRSRPRSREYASSSSSSSAQPCTSPMMSNGPCSDVRLFQSGWRSISTSSISWGEFSTKTCRKPSFFKPPRERRSCCIWLRTTCGPKSRSGRLPVPFVGEFLRKVENDRHRDHMVAASQLDQRLAILALHAGGIDHGKFARGRGAWRR